jgi:hypothetical protein
MSPIIGFKVVSYTLLFCETDMQGTWIIDSSPILFVTGRAQNRFACSIMLEDTSPFKHHSDKYLQGERNEKHSDPEAD